jgi:hypothetical protein
MRMALLHRWLAVDPGADIGTPDMRMAGSHAQERILHAHPNNHWIIRTAC